MRQTITYELCTELRNFQHCVEASTVGLRPGEWPSTLEVAPAFGNGQPLLRANMEHTEEGELFAVNYRQLCGVLVLRIFND